MLKKPLKYEVALSMLPTGATGPDLFPFCQTLEKVMEETEDPFVRIVPTFYADNRNACRGWGWPTVPQWNMAVERYFGVKVLDRMKQT